nr:MAG TPA: hypothetical protein [Caudoviricetes sp.]
MMKDTSGPMSSMQLSIFDHAPHSLRTFADTSHWDSPKCWKTLPASGGMRSGHVYERPTWELHTTGSGFSFLPTPTASDHKRADSPADQRRNSPGITTCTVHWPGLTMPPTSTTR